jgi:hypothetical protein
MHLQCRQRSVGPLGLDTCLSQKYQDDRFSSVSSRNGWDFDLSIQSMKNLQKVLEVVDRGGCDREFEAGQHQKPNSIFSYTDKIR